MIMDYAANKAQFEKTLTKQWHEIKGKLDSILISHKMMNIDDTRKACATIINIDPSERESYIIKMWGPRIIDKVHSLLQQLTAIEHQLASLQN